MFAIVTPTSTAADETWRLLAAADVRTREAEEVLDLMRGTHDGDDLSAMDLRLAESVINWGVAALPAKARARWAEVTELVARGCYPTPVQRLRATGDR